MINIILTAILLSFGTGYIPLQDQTWENCFKEQVTIQNYNLNYRYCSNKKDYDFVGQNIEKITKAVFQFAAKNNLNNEECIPNSNLEVYDISLRTLNQRYRFKNFHGTRTIWGLYDPRPQESNISSIMLTTHSSNVDREILAHEVSHYWFDRLCWNKDWLEGKEEFAQKFEYYYMRNQK